MSWIPINEVPIYTPQRRRRLVVIGAGLAGLMIAHKVQHEFRVEDSIDLVIYEKNEDVGGTWYETRYLGAGLDVPSHVYTFRFAPNPNWSKFHVEREEVWNYIRETTTKFELDKHVEFKRKVVAAEWNGELGKWRVTTENTATREQSQELADIVVDCSGLLNKWRWPEIAGRENFKGHMVHSARWDEKHSYAGENVCIIGNGASGIQLLPQLVEATGGNKTVVNLIRNPTWILENFGLEFTPDGHNFTFSEEEKQKFRDQPQVHRQYRHDLELSSNKRFPGLHKDSPEQEALRIKVTESMKQRLGYDESLIAKLIPNYHVGCRKATPGMGYLECFASGRADVVIGRIARFTETGIVLEDGQELDFDAIICATGFDTSFDPTWKLTGLDGVELAGLWKEYGGAYAYFGVVLPQMPNYFIVNGPNAAAGHALILTGMATAVDYIFEWVLKLSRESIRSMVVKEKAIHDYNVYTQEFLKRMVWSDGGCGSWYKAGGAEGRVSALYGGSMLHYMEMMSKIRGEDFELEYDSANMFGFLGNGYSTLEARIRDEPDVDLAYYVR
ncbi:uncharacterized protein V1516DRAFT_670121 [Lipomyces oligophaga]|uniref:uncharacterized protein n=1 Tax=Lipomyces oligophaga TaxID=45792 RepID=UPI0034CEF102